MSDKFQSAFEKVRCEILLFNNPEQAENLKKHAEQNQYASLSKQANLSRCYVDNSLCPTLAMSVTGHAEARLSERMQGKAPGTEKPEWTVCP
ncbi:hypothetical protein [Sodalis ligni]|uniref:hypothetical protein n=1 Tax=Sodalis ligni TaxID=2697027 RepID=UPI0010472E87|nr:hypothetical protein [Sodalis ligni]